MTLKRTWFSRLQIARGWPRAQRWLVDVEHTVKRKTYFVCPQIVVWKELIRSVLIPQTFVKFHAQRTVVWKHALREYWYGCTWSSWSIRGPLIMSMGWEYVSELRQSTALLPIPLEIYEHAALWWNDIDRGSFLFVHQRSLWNHTSSHLLEKQEELAKEIINLAIQVSVFILRQDV
jgi:hypothetical protein